MPSPLARRPVAPRSRAQAVVEFAVVLPVLLVLLMGVGQLGTILATQIGIVNAVREAAREASTLPTTTDAQATANGSWTVGRLVSSLLPSAPSFDASHLVLTGSDPTAVCFTSATDVLGQTVVHVRVRAVYAHPLWLPAIATILDGIDGVQDGALRIGADETFQVEGSSGAGLSGPACAS